MFLISNHESDDHVNMKILNLVEDPPSLTQLEVVSSQSNEKAALGVEPHVEPYDSIEFPLVESYCLIIIYY